MSMPAKTMRSKRPAKQAKRPIGLAKKKLKLTKSFLKFTARVPNTEGFPLLFTRHVTHYGAHSVLSAGSNIVKCGVYHRIPKVEPASSMSSNPLEKLSPAILALQW